MHYKFKTSTASAGFQYNFWIIIFVCLVPCMLPAQQKGEYTFSHITQADGLLAKNVRAVVQDGKGFIWLLTSNGLQRYDGERFVNFPYEVNSKTGIKDAGTSDLFADKKNNCLWITNQQMQKFNLQENSFITYDTSSILTQPDCHFKQYTEQPDITWRAGEVGFVSNDPSLKNSSKHFFSAPDLSPNRSNVFLSDKQNGEYWVVDWRGLFLLDRKTSNVYTHSNNPHQHAMLQAMDKKRLTGIFRDSNNNFWFSTNEQFFYKYNPALKKLSTYALSAITKKITGNQSTAVTMMVKCFFEDNHRNIWIGTENAGLLQYNKSTDTFLYTLSDENNFEGLHYNFRIENIFQDDEENIWLSTDKGINIFNPYQQSYQIIRNIKNNSASLPKNEIMDFIQTANGDMLIGTWGGGITIYDSSWNFKKTISFPTPYEYNLIWSFVQNDDGTVWIGCQHGYIHIYNPFSETLRTIHPVALHNFTIRTMTKDKKGNIWLGLHDGKIAKWDKQKNIFLGYGDSEVDASKNLPAVKNIFFDTKQRCWVTTETAFKQFDTESKIYSATYLPNENNPNSISAFTSQGMAELNDSTMLIGTLGGGLNFFNTNSKTFTHLTTKDGLPANSIHAIKKDIDGAFWFATDFDLVRFNSTNKKFIRLTIGNDKLNGSFGKPAFYSLQDGRWLAATNAELIGFNTKGNFSGINNKKIAITGFKIFDKYSSIDRLLDAGSPVKLSYLQNFLTVEFSALHFSNNQQTNYYYQLTGIDKDWVNAGTKSFASYTKLQPGEYTFSVKADDGNDNIETTSFTIIIVAPFWNTWWFIALLVLTTLLLVYLFIKGRLKSIKAVATEKLKVQQLNAEQYKNKLELEQIINYFSSSMIDKNTVDAVLWDVAKNLIGRLGFEDCMIYLWNADKAKMVQRAGYGPKGSIEEIEKNIFDVLPGQGVVGYVMQTNETVMIPDTSKDNRYRVDEMQRLSEITVPIIYNDELIGVIDSEHSKKYFFTQQHTQVLSTIATLTANKIKSIESEQSLQQTKIEMLGINEKLSAAKLEALQSQLNPHFIFNCLNSIDNLIQTNQPDKATTYLARFAKLIRLVLDSSKNNVMPFQQDFETLGLYLELEKFRCNNKFNYTLTATPDLLNGDYRVPPLLIQPFIENAIHHGLLNKQSTDRMLQVNIVIKENFINYVVTDNGIGRKKAAEIKKLNKPEYTSYGIAISKERIALYNKGEKDDIAISDLSIGDETPGTKVTIYVKIKD